MVPTNALGLSGTEVPKYCFSANRPRWVSEVKKGDIIVSGKKFGTGSSRPGAKVLKPLGISCLAAESINGLFLRNCVNFGLPALPCMGVFETFQEGDMAEIDFKEGKTTNLVSKTVIKTSPLPAILINITNAGGVVPMLEKEGYFE
jgi:3-isopropylmalate/(R)-2-methylmalate dehydratase small subunit